LYRKRTSRNHVLLFGILATSLFFTTCDIKNQKLSIVRVQGNAFVDQSGQRLIFRGLCFSDLHKLVDDGKWNKSHFQVAKEWGANVIRIPVHPLLVRERGITEYLTYLDQGIQWAEELGLYVIIDWHSIGNLKENKFPRDVFSTTRRETFDFWETIARRYRGKTAVAFYELFNEPASYFLNLGSLSWSEWKVLCEDLIDLIYAIDKTKIILVAGLNWAYLLDEVMEKPIERENIAYVTHPYPQKASMPWEPKWEKHFGHVSDKYPVFATEFGFMSADEKGAHIPCIGDENFGKRIMNYFYKKNISWTVWCFDPDWPPALIKSWDYSLSFQGRFFKNVLQNKVYTFPDTE
jgi:endoglucanase